jgi:hypothetical protein
MVPYWKKNYQREFFERLKLLFSHFDATQINADPLGFCSATLISPIFFVKGLDPHKFLQVRKLSPQTGI